MLQSRHRLLERVTLFSGLRSEQLAEMAEVAGMHRFAAHGYLFREGEAPDFVYAVLSGSVALLMRDGTRDSVIDFVGPGGLLPLPSALLKTPYVVSARATTDGQAMLMPSAMFRQFVQNDRVLSQRCAAEMARSWLMLVAQMRDARSQTAIERLVHFLVEQSGREAGPATLTLPGMKKEIAARLGIKPETLSRTLKKLSAYGVDSKGDTVRVADLERLVSLAAAEAHIPVSERREMANPPAP